MKSVFLGRKQKCILLERSSPDLHEETLAHFFK